MFFEQALGPLVRLKQHLAPLEEGRAHTLERAEAIHSFLLESVELLLGLANESVIVARIQVH